MVTSLQPRMFILTVAVDYRPEHFSSAQIPARCARAGKRIITLKAPITTAADDIHNIFSLFFQEK